MKFVFKNRRVVKTKYVLDLEKGYEIKPKLRGFDIDKIVLYDEGMISFYIEKSFLIKLKKILEEIMDSDEGGSANVLSSLNSLEYIILNEYKAFLPIETIRNMLKEIYMLRQKFANTFNFNNYSSYSDLSFYNSINTYESEGRGR